MASPRPQTSPPPPPLCDIPSGCCSFTGPWTVTRSPLRMLRRVAVFCRPLRPVLLLVSFPRSRSPVVGVLGLCWLWRDVPFVCQRRPIVGVLRMCWLLPGSPPPDRQRNPNKSAEQIGEPIFQQNRFPMPWISVPGPKHAFLLVALRLESCGNPKYLSIFKKKFHPPVCTWSLSSRPPDAVSTLVVHAQCV